VTLTGYTTHLLTAARIQPANGRSSQGAGKAGGGGGVGQEIVQFIDQLLTVFFGGGTPGGSGGDGPG
jgi:hypothetical protein